MSFPTHHFNRAATPEVVLKVLRPPGLHEAQVCLQENDLGYDSQMYYVLKTKAHFPDHCSHLRLELLRPIGGMLCWTNLAVCLTSPLIVFSSTALKGELRNAIVQAAMWVQAYAEQWSHCLQSRVARRQSRWTAWATPLMMLSSSLTCLAWSLLSQSALLASWTLTGGSSQLSTRC